MNAFEDFYFLGKIIRPHGYLGKVSAYFDTDEPELYSSLELVYIDVNGSPVPYFICNLQLLNNKAVIEFQDVDKLEKAEILIQKDLYLPLSTLPELKGNKFYYHEISGFTVIDEKFGIVGKVNEVLDYTNQAVMQIFRDEKEILIPINSYIIVSLNREQKEIHVRAPEGLIELYLEN